MSDPEHRLQCRDVLLAHAELLYDPQAMRMRQHTHQAREPLVHDGTCLHVQIFEYEEHTSCPTMNRMFLRRARARGVAFCEQHTTLWDRATACHHPDWGRTRVTRAAAADGRGTRPSFQRGGSLPMPISRGARAPDEHDVVHGGQEEAAEVLAQTSEDLVRSFAQFRRECSLRTWFPRLGEGRRHPARLSRRGPALPFGRGYFCGVKKLPSRRLPNASNASCPIVS